jgi:alkanesulfonate monooxygenase SsuD/methylene tetrahydromethanopterin reductase-like flavin-dependent oxidoreductase (luciferase family)
MKFGLWYDFRNPPRWRRPYEELYRESLEQIAWAERAGFESVWLSEHHVTDDGYMPAIFPMLAAIAVRTSTLRIGSAILLAPLQHPIRFAEDAAVVDQLSGGRLELGLGLGYRIAEFETLGVPRGERPSRMEELVGAARLAWSGERFTFEGRHWRFRDVQVTPPPRQPDGPPLWLAGSVPAAARRAGRLGCHFMPDAGVAPAVVELYERTLADHGHPASSRRVAINPSIHVCEDPQQGWDAVKEHYLYSYNGYRRWYAEGGDSTAPTLDDPDALPRDRYLVGTPDDVVAAIQALRAQVPFDRLFFWARPPGLSLEESYRSLELFARDVMPRLAEL